MWIVLTVSFCCRLQLQNVLKVLVNLLCQGIKVQYLWCQQNIKQGINKKSYILSLLTLFVSSPSVTNSGDFVDSPGSRKNLRMYIQEGPVKLLVVSHVIIFVMWLSCDLQVNKQSMLQSQERYLFLFSDLMLIAKGGKSRYIRYNLVKRPHLHLLYTEHNNIEFID